MQYVKCGFAGENFPTSVFPCVVGRPMLRYEESLMEQELMVSLLFFAFIYFLYLFIIYFHFSNCMRECFSESEVLVGIIMKTFCPTSDGILDNIFTMFRL